MKFLRQSIVVVLLFCLTITVCAQDPQEQDPDIIRVDTSLTNLLFTATDKQNRYITTLKEQDLRLIEDGVEFIRKVRELPPERGGKIPAVALTAYARAEDRLRVLRSGFQMYVAKPVELDELVAIVASVAGRV